MIVSVPLPFIGTFSWTSRGHIDAFGLAPDQYIEKRGHRPEDVTTFNRADKRISFTHTPTTLPLPDGAQDRFSMVMQLASLVRGDPDAYQPGVTREFFVADNDSGETWPVITVGDESVGTDHGYVSARHFMRLPRHAGDRRRIDVWLAPSLGWLPVRLLQTEPNGTQFELVWRGPLTVPSSGAAAGASAAASGAETSNAGAATAIPAAPDTATPALAPAAAPNTAMPAPAPSAAPDTTTPASAPSIAPDAATPAPTPSTAPDAATPAPAPSVPPIPAAPPPAAPTGGAASATPGNTLPAPPSDPTLKP
jgi:hypothetical protein